MKTGLLSEPYYYVRFRWRRISNSIELIEKLKGDFALTLYPREREDGKLYDWSPQKGHRWEILARADTLSAFLSESRAVLFQRMRAPFSKRDMKLREMAFLLYPHNGLAPFLPFLIDEPPFEVEQR